MTDIFEHWKKNKFITVDYDLLDGPEILVILTDISYWAEHEQELTAWCNQYGAALIGMAITFPDKKTLTAFALRWS